MDLNSPLFIGPTSVFIGVFRKVMSIVSLPEFPMEIFSNESASVFIKYDSEYKNK